jgi:hypothetical protein
LNSPLFPPPPHTFALGPAERKSGRGAVSVCVNCVCLLCVIKFPRLLLFHAASHHPPHTNHRRRHSPLLSHGQLVFPVPAPPPVLRPGRGGRRPDPPEQHPLRRGRQQSAGRQWWRGQGRRPAAVGQVERTEEWIGQSSRSGWEKEEWTVVFQECTTPAYACRESLVYCLLVGISGWEEWRGFCPVYGLLKILGLFQKVLILPNFKNSLHFQSLPPPSPPNHSLNCTNFRAPM